MDNLKFYSEKLELKDALLIHFFNVGDNRGFFLKSFDKDHFKDMGIDFEVDEVFISSSMKNVIRGLHFQTRYPQSKVVSVLQGRVWDVIVDLRQESPTFKQWQSVELSENDSVGIFVPRGFAHGFASLEDDTVMLYQCCGKYNPDTDTGIIFNDPEIGINWPMDDKVAIHSPRDLTLGSLRDYFKHPMEQY